MEYRVQLRARYPLMPSKDPFWHAREISICTAAEIEASDLHPKLKEKRSFLAHKYTLTCVTPRNLGRDDLHAGQNCVLGAATTLNLGTHSRDASPSRPIPSRGSAG